MRHSPLAPEEIADRLQAALEKYGWWQGDRLVVHAIHLLEAVLPEQFADPPISVPDAAIDALQPGGTLADRDLHALERLGAMLKKGPRSRRDHRKHYQVVVETASGPGPREKPLPL